MLDYMPQQIPVYSIAKPFLAQAVLALGVDLDQGIGHFLPDLAQVYGERKIAKLLNHTSGLSDYSQLPEYVHAVDKREPAWSRPELLAKCEGLPNDILGFQYSNVGYLLVRMLLEQQTGTSSFVAIRQLVLDPLRISGLSDWNQISDIVPDYDPGWVYHGTFLASEDSIKAAFLKLVKHRSATIGLGAGMTLLPYEGTGFEHPGYSYGFMNDVDLATGMPTFVGHGGGGPGFAHMILVNTETWDVALETSTSGLDQAAAIVKHRFLENFIVRMIWMRGILKLPKEKRVR